MKKRLYNDPPPPPARDPPRDGRWKRGSVDGWPTDEEMDRSDKRFNIAMKCSYVVLGLIMTGFFVGAYYGIWH